MEDNNKVNNIDKKNDVEHYSSASGTGVWSSIIFMLVTVVAMYFIAKFMGN